MYVTSETTFTQAGVGGPGNGQLVASFGLMSTTVIVTTLTTVSGVPTVSLDALLGDNQNVNLAQNLDTSWASGAISTGLTVPTGAGASASFTVVGVWRGLRINVGWGTPGGSFKVQIAARDIN
jgi:hypothetical protein